MQSIASNYNTEDFELIIVDLGSKQNSFDILKEYKFNIKYEYIPYFGNFCKSRCLNYAFKKTSGNIITMVDIDSILPCGFLYNVDYFFKNNKNKRLSHRVRIIDKDITKNILNLDINCDIIQKYLIDDYLNHGVAKERFTEKNIEKHYIKDIDEQELYNNHGIGNSHFSASRDIYLELGGYDERFVGWGYEDLDFNRRMFGLLKSAYLETRPEYTVYHTYHKRDYFKWRVYNLQLNNERRYLDSRDNNIIKLPMSESWGCFD